MMPMTAWYPGESRKVRAVCLVEACRRALAMGAAAGALIFALLAGPGAAAKVPQVEITPDADLRFGSILVFGSGARVVSPSGSVTDLGLHSVASGDTGPAAFTISYDRGNESRRAIDLEIELVFAQPSAQVLGGVSGRLSAFETDLPGAPASCRARPSASSCPIVRRVSVRAASG
jgi:hypothetical protein